MSVFLTTMRWKNSRVPYEFKNKADVNNSLVKSWFQEVNGCIDFGLLLPRCDTDVDYIEVNYGGSGKSEQIGCKGGKQTISGTNKETLIHELLHALGFKHEQLHKKFPWNDNDPKLVRVDRCYSYSNKCTTSNNIALFNAIIKQGGNDFFASNNLNSRLEAILDKDTEHWGDCDLDSVMMYPAIRAAVLSVNMGRVQGVKSSGMSGLCNVLSSQDVEALKYVYPKPPPPPPVDFVITFSGQPDDSLVMKFVIRSLSHPERSNEYQTDASGRVVVRGFDPKLAEIRVEPWLDWSRISIDPNTVYGLPGGRYTYSATFD